VDRGQVLEPRADGREALQLARRDAKPVARIVAELREAEDLLAARAEERAGEPAEDGSTPRVLARQAAEPSVDHDGRVVPLEASAVRIGRGEDFGWNDVGEHGRSLGEHASSVKSHCF